MAFCSDSTEKLVNDKTEIDNLFISNFLPQAPDMAVKVYLYGLYLCKKGETSENSIESFASELNISEQVALECFEYWQEQGLVRVLSSCPIEIKFMPLKNVLWANKRFSKDKYADFNAKIQNLFDRMISPNEYTEYYTFIESSHIQQDALIMIAKYCVEKKSRGVGYSYILTVAKNWISEGIFTCEDVAERIDLYSKQTDSMKEVLKALKISRMATVDEFDYFSKWTEKLGFTIDVLCSVAKQQRKKRIKFDFASLDAKLMKYYGMGLLSFEEIENYENGLDEKFSIAKGVCKNLGLFYENLEPVVENYITKWQLMGFDSEVIINLTTFCFKKSIKSLEGMNDVLQKLWSKGIVSKDALMDYFEELSATDEKIKEILHALKLSRQVTTFDRENYRIWKNAWDMSDELVKLACEMSCDKFQPMQYMNKLLSLWHESKIADTESAKNCLPKTCNMKRTKSNTNDKIETHEFSKENISALFDSLDEVEI